MKIGTEKQAATVIRGIEWKQSLGLWALFFALLVVVNGTVPFIFGYDLRAWSSSIVKGFTLGILIYGGMFLVAPLVLIKGWKTVRHTGFLVPLLVAVAGAGLWALQHYAAALIVVSLVYLHWKYDLTGFGIRSKGFGGDLSAILLLGLLQLLPVLFTPGTLTFSPTAGVAAGLGRLLANPASTCENLFYFGFMSERLSTKFGRVLTPLIIGLMYTLHEMSNPEYWYSGMQFGIVFVGITITSALYLWRRSVVSIWLGDSLGKFFASLF